MKLFFIVMQYNFIQFASFAYNVLHE